MGNAAPIENPSEINTLPALGAAFDSWNEGGEYAGRGAAQLVSSAVLGLPQVAAVAPCEFLGNGLAPAHCAYTGKTDPRDQ